MKALLLTVLAVACSAQAPATTPLDVADEPQLFLDDWLIAERRGLKRALHRPIKHGLIRDADGRPWDRGDVYHGNIVCRDARGKFHMTYRYLWSDPALRDHPHPSIGKDKAHWFRQAVAYATSDDGVCWHKPKLGLLEGPTGFCKVKDYPFEVPAGLSKDNNLGCPIDFIHDLHAYGGVADPRRRFLLRVVQKDDTHPFAKVVKSQMYYAADWPDFAGDPRWKEKLTPVPGATLSPRGFLSLAGYDEAARTWFAVSQDTIGNWLPRGGRDIARYASPDLVKWSGPELVLPVAKDESKTKTDWVEYMELSAHRVGGPKTGAWLGQLVVFHSDRSDPRFQWPLGDGVWRKGTTEVRLVLSRDAGKSWRRVGGKEAWLPHSADEHGYDRLAFAACPVHVGDELWLYYSAWDGDHLVFNRDGSLYEPGFVRTGRTARATLRRDGYVSLDAGKDGGRLVTKPLRFAGGKLVVNLAAPNGTLRAELQDASGRPLPGFRAADCEAVTGDGVALPVRWRGKSDVRELAGRTVRLRLELINGSLYAFQFVR